MTSKKDNVRSLPSKKSTTAYKLLILSGWFGGHQYYLGQWRKGFFIAICFLMFIFSILFFRENGLMDSKSHPLEWTLFYIGILGVLVWFYDLFTLPKQVEQANVDESKSPSDILNSVLKNGSVYLASAICFKIYSDGQWIFYPWGPYTQGYLVRDLEYENKLTRFLNISLIGYALLWGIKLYDLFPGYGELIFIPYIVLFLITGRLLARPLTHVAERYTFSEMHRQALVGLFCIYVLFVLHLGKFIWWFIR